ncbi:MAG TPA: glycosyl hydrolase family 18 protein, partial [Balneolales bacterium]|nr:glycosyl hydrolase family 18 protein [Balneolales bacterium]
MKKLKVFLLLSFLFVISAGPLMAQQYKSENLFYLTSSLDGFQSFKEHASEISIVVPAVYNVDGYGVIAGSLDHRIMDIAKKNGVKVMPLIGTMNQKNIHNLLSDSASRARMINMMLYLAKENNYYGWQLDLENIHLTDRDNYTSFFKQAADSLHKYGFKISMAVVKFDRPTPEPGHSVSYTRYVYENWRGAFDIKALAKASDFLSLMTYDENTAQTPP